MSNPFNVQWVNSDVVLRGAAISMVAANHANPYSEFLLGLGGGMTFLMMLSGFNFARFALQTGEPSKARHSIVRMISALFWPSLAIVVFCFVLLRTVDLPELMFIGNWFSVERIAKFPVWYVQVLLQILLALLLVFSVRPIASSILQRPLWWSLGLLGAALVVRLVFPQVWDTDYLYHRLPHLYFWNFVLGWFVFFAIRRKDDADERTLWTTAASAALVLCSALVWGLDLLQFWWLSIAGVLLIWFDRLPVPRVVAWLVVLVSQSTFVIFLTHRLFYEVYEDIFGVTDPSGAVLWLFGMGGGVAVWVFASAARRAYATTWRGAQASRPLDRTRDAQVA